MREFAPQQESLGQLEVRPGRAGIERQRASGAGDAFVELEASIMHDSEIVEGLEIVPVGLERLAADPQGLVIAAETFIDRAQAAPEIDRFRRQLDGALDHFGRGLMTAGTKEHDPLLSWEPRI